MVHTNVLPTTNIVCNLSFVGHFQPCCRSLCHLNVYVVSRNQHRYNAVNLEGNYSCRNLTKISVTRRKGPLLPLRVLASTTEEVVKNKCEHLAVGFGWRVRLATQVKEELEQVADIQAQSFHEKAPLLDRVFFSLFKADILNGIYSSIRSSPPNRYGCLVAEVDCESLLSEMTDTIRNKIVGVVEATADRRRRVLCHLEGVDEYLYIHSMSVRECYRRKKIATVLLKACDYLAILWGFDYLALQAFEDDIGARSLYDKAGYKVASRDPSWRTTILRQKPRILMIKKVKRATELSATPNEY